MKKNKRITKIISVMLVLGLILNPSATDASAKSKKIKLNKKKITIKVKKTYQLKLVKSKKKITSTKIKWKSTNKKIATVNKKGIVKAKKVGKCTVVATYKKKNYKCKVVVTGSSKANTKPTKKPSGDVKPTATPVPTVVPTPDVKSLSVKQIEEWNKGNDAYDFVKGKNGKVSFISGKVADFKVTNKDEAYKAVSAIKLLDDSKDIDLVYIRTEKDMHGDIYYRFMQYLNGFIMNNSVVVLGTDKDGNTISYSNNLKADTSEIDDDNIISAQKAVRRVKMDVPEFERVEGVEPHLTVKYFDYDNKFYWVVLGKNTSEPKEGEEYYPYINYYVDAITGYARFYEMTKDSSNAVQNVEVDYEFPMVSTEEMEFTNAWGEKVKLPVAKDEDGEYYIIDSDRMIEVRGGLDDDKNTISNEHFTFEKPEDISPNFVSLIENVILTYDLLDSYGYKGPDGNGAIPIRIHLGWISNGEELDNACAIVDEDGSVSIIAGDTIGNATMDTVSHEYTHAIRDTKIENEYSHLSGAFEESYADIIGNLVQMNALDDKHCDKDTWALFEMQNGTTEKASRVMADPESSSCSKKVGGLYWISCMNAFENNDKSGVHENSGVLNYIAYSLFKNKNINMSYENYLKVWFSTIFLANEDSKFDEIKAYLKYSMRRYSFYKNDKAIDEVFGEANIDKLDEYKWTYDLEDGYTYLKIDKSSISDEKDIVADVYWDEDGTLKDVTASDYDETHLIAMVPKGIEAYVSFTAVYNNDRFSDLLSYWQKVSVADKEKTIKYNPELLVVGYDDTFATWVYRPNYLEMKKKHDAEVFYVGPTSIEGDENELNMNIFDETNRYYFEACVNVEKGIYDSNALFYAPYYRQQTLAGYNSSKEKAAYAKNRARYDIYDAFSEFMKNHEEGVPIILAGSGQGAEMIKFIISCMGDNEAKYTYSEQKKKMFFDDFVAAYAPGWYFEDEFLAKNPKIKMAKGETDTSVIVSFCSEAEDYNESTLILPKGMHTNGINPLNWKTDSTPASKDENIGACVVNEEGLIEEVMPGLCGAYLDETRGTLKVTGISKDDYPALSIGLEDGNYRDYDTQFFYSNLKRNVRKRIEAFTK